MNTRIACIVGSKDRRRGYLFTEAVTCVALLGLIIALSASGILKYQHTRHITATRQAAAWTAAAQLQRLQAGAPLDSLPPSDVMPGGIELKTSAAPRAGRWEGFQLVTVSATAVISEREKVSEHISGYVRTEAKP